MALQHDTVVRLLLSGRLGILAYIRSIVRDFDLAEDIFQEVSMLALAKRKKIRDADHFAGWIRQAARYESLSMLRKRRGLPSLLSESTLDLLDATWDHDDSEAQNQRIEALHDCIGELTERSQSIVNLRYIQGMKGAELACVLQRPVNTVYVALSRIHRFLGDCVRKHATMEGGGHV